MNNIPKHESVPEHEWQLQERAVREARDGVGGGDDPMLAQYRQVARALRRPQPDRLPADFAARVAALATAQPQHVADTRIEQQLLRMLMAGLALAAAVFVALQGAQWLQVLDASVPGATSHWMLALLGCVGASWLPWLRSQSLPRQA